MCVCVYSCLQFWPDSLITIEHKNQCQPQLIGQLAMPTYIYWYDEAISRTINDYYINHWATLQTFSSTWKMFARFTQFLLVLVHKSHRISSSLQWKTRIETVDCANGTIETVWVANDIKIRLYIDRIDIDAIGSFFSLLDKSSTNQRNSVDYGCNLYNSILSEIAHSKMHS